MPAAFIIALVAALTVAAAALALVLARDKLRKTSMILGKKFGLIASRIATLGYGIPSTVLAVGIFVPIAFLDNWLIDLFVLERDAIFKGTFLVFILAFLVRFLALGVQSVEAGAARINAGFMEAAFTLGKTPREAYWQVYLPMIKGALGVAMLMTFVDVMKEIPITLMMRPTGFDMLSARIYAFTTEGMYDKAAFPSLVIVLVGLLPVWYFFRMLQK